MMSIQPSNTSNQYIDQDGQENLIKLLNLVSYLSKSLAPYSNLDDLLKSAITLIHERFGIEKVSIYLFTSQDSTEVLMYGIAEKVIETTTKLFGNIDNDPISWVLSKSETLLIDDVGSDPRFSRIIVDKNIKSEMIIPILFDGSILGALDLSSNELNRFGTSEKIAFQSFCEHLGIFIKNAEEFTKELLHHQISEEIYDLIANIPVNIVQEDVLNKFLVALENYFPYMASGIWLFENNVSDNGIGQLTTGLKIADLRISLKQNSEINQLLDMDIDDVLHRMRQEEDSAELLTIYPWLADVINSTRASIKNNGSNNDPLSNALGLHGNFSTLGIPLQVDGQTLGIIIILLESQNQSISKSIFIANIFSKFASLAIKNIGILSAAHDQAWISTVLQQVIETFQSLSSVPEFLESSARLIVSLAGAYACTIYFWDESIISFVPQICYGYEPELQNRLEEWDVVTDSVDAFKQLLLSDNPVILNSENIPDEIASFIFPKYDLRENLLILFPMIGKEGLIGAVLIDFMNSKLEKDSSQKIWDDTYSIIQSIIQQATVFLESYLAIKSREEEAYISIALLQVAQAIVSLNQLDDILGSIVRITPILVGVKRCIIYLLDKDKLVFSPSQYYGFSKNDLQFENKNILYSEFPLLETIATNNKITYHQLAPDSSPSDWSDVGVTDLHILLDDEAGSGENKGMRFDTEILRENSRLLIGFPLSVLGEVMGIMVIEEEDPIKGAPSYHIRQKRIEIVNGITQQAAIAIKNEQLRREVVRSERMERELQLAREIQETFLPESIPIVDGWNMDAKWRPARQVAGDFYDFLDLDENRFGFVIADVADKGMPAALFMVLIRTLLRAAAKDNPSPADVLRQVNDLLCRDSKNGLFVTIVYVMVDTKTGIITYANAGHNPPVVMDTNSIDLTELTRTGMALGIFPNIEIDEREVLLNHGDWIMFYTDGLTEAFSIEQEMYGTARLLEVLRDHHFTNPIELLNIIDRSVHDFIKGSELSDDLTLAAIFRN